ncbi:peptidoglycan DD-metalloendopeptidase family protein [Paenisporosarcina sp. TG20]|uniref:peptidoglycan DD-metalloendopeptidase family protein n=1 Tax=Paenisporosarcina sp. TG20 TaxID=1211706 RepID=UPI00030E2398|nr:peptidoglycan DD-metalloendopeptidase family protein [Paenisporosarcina sp. TG20]
MNLKRNNTLNIIQKTAIIVLFTSSLTMSTGFANDNDSAQLQKVFHIYASDQYVGVVSDENAVKELVNDKLAIANTKYDNLILSAGSNISIVSEQVFNKQTNDTIILDKLDSLITIETDAFALSVNNEIAVYVSDLATYDEVVKNLKLQSVSEKELAELEKRKHSQQSLPELKNNETRIVEVNLSESVSGVTQQTKPENIMTAAEAVKYLLRGTLEEKVYIVQSGDVLSKIASKHDITSAKLTELNNGVDENSILQIGQELLVTDYEPLVNVEVVREKKVTEEVQFKNQEQKSDEMFKGDSKVIQEGSNGIKETTYLIHEQNGIQIDSSVQQEVVVKEMKNNIVLNGTKIIPSRGTGHFSWPAVGGYISSKMGNRWGSFHRGIDIARPSDYTIKASDNGVVTFAGRDGSYGNKVVVNHNNGYETVYAHLASINVNIGQSVPVGTNLGIMGATGRSTGIHLHFEIIQNGKIIDPLSLVRQ